MDGYHLTVLHDIIGNGMETEGPVLDMETTLIPPAPNSNQPRIIPAIRGSGRTYFFLGQAESLLKLSWSVPNALLLPCCPSRCYGDRFPGLLGTRHYGSAAPVVGGRGMLIMETSPGLLSGLRLARPVTSRAMEFINSTNHNQLENRSLTLNFCDETRLQLRYYY